MDYFPEDFEKAFLKCGLKNGDSVFLTTSLGMLGKPKMKKKITYNNIAKILISSIVKIIGKKGNIFVPTYSYSFGKSYGRKIAIYSVKNTKSAIGDFANFFLKQKGRVRSLDPMVSVSGIGVDCKNILQKVSYTSYGKNCVFERLLRIKNLKCCTVGLGYNWIPFIHYLDWLNKVPFRHDKYFKGTIILNNKKKKKIYWHYPVRFLEVNTEVDGYKLGKLALKSNLFKYCNLGKSKIYVINYKNFFEFAKQNTTKNKWLTASARGSI